MNIKLNSVSRFSSYRAVDTCFSAIKPNQLILREEIIAACSEKRTLHKTTLCVQNLILNLGIHILTTYL